MPRRKARPEADLVKLPRAGNFDQAIRKYLERNPPEYSEKRMTFPLPKDRADLDGLVSLARNELSKVPIIDQEGKRHGDLFRKAGDETYLANPLHPYFSKVKHSC
jgi:hypothetical protein